MQCHSEQLAVPRRVSCNLLKTGVCVLLALGSLCAAPLLTGQASPAPPAREAATEKSPALVDPTGPDISLQTSEALFDIAAALNSCGYDQGLAESDPVRQSVREEINAALQGSAEAREVHDQLCVFVDQHRIAGAGQDLAQYVSLALYITPPPALTTSAADSDMPFDATQVEEILPLLRNFSQLIDLHLIWLHHRLQYDQELNWLHDSLTQMIVNTNAYLKMPVSSHTGQRFLVVLEPLLDPGQTNARIYGTDYVVVASPVKGAIHMTQVRHTYLHYEIEPLLYARASAMDRFLPFLKTIRDAPLDYAYHSDVLPLVIESMIRAIEARTMDTGVTIVKIPENIRRSDLEAATHEHNASMERAEAVRRNAVQQSMTQGYVLTDYFYRAFATFEKEPESFKESIGPMVYGMDVESELSRVKHITFDEQAQADVVHRAPQPPKGLDLAEIKLMKGDADGAGALAQQSLNDRSGDPARANFILARVAIMHRDVPGAQHGFEETIRLSKDPRLLAWSHIYLGRIYDLQEERDQAVAEYRTALTVRDGQPDTKLAAEKGIKQPYAVPQQAHTGADDSDSDGDDPDAENQDSPKQPQPGQPTKAEPAQPTKTQPAQPRACY